MTHSHDAGLRDTRLTGSLHECRAECDFDDAGHVLSPMRRRLAAATPSKFADAVVVAVSAVGWIEVAPLASETTILLWNHGDLTRSIAPGDPVAVHSVYDVLAVGDSRHHVVRADSL